MRGIAAAFLAKSTPLPVVPSPLWSPFSFSRCRRPLHSRSPRTDLLDTLVAAKSRGNIGLVDIFLGDTVR